MTVRRGSYLLCAFTAVVLAAKHHSAEDGILVISVSDPKGKPIPGVVLSTKGDGATGSPTDISGKTRIRLAPQTRPGSWVTLQVTKVMGARDLVFISPWDQRAIVPPFSNETENYVPVIIAERGSRDVLASKDALVALAARIATTSVPRTPQGAKSSDHKAKTLEDAAQEYGLSANDIDLAMRSLSQKLNDPYGTGVASFYKGDFPEASVRLTEALKASIEKTSGQQREAKIVDAAFFLGRSLYEQRKYQEAANAFRQALRYREGDADLLANLGLASLSIKSQTATATEGSTIIQAQATTQYNYFSTVQKDGTASSLIASASGIAELQSLLGLINRDAGAAFGLWETQLRKYYENAEPFSHTITPRVTEATAIARTELRDIQRRCADALSKSEVPAARAQLFLLDGLASELAAKAGQSRPITR